LARLHLWRGASRPEDGVVTEEPAADRALGASEARYRARYRVVAETADEGIWAVTLTGETLYANARTSELLGLGEGWPRDLGALERVDPRAAAELRRRLAVRHARGPERYEITYAHPDGRERCLRVSAAPLRQADDGVEGSLGMISDITAVREAEQELREAALRDSLTGLPNRPLLTDRLTHALARPGSVTSVLLIDLDDFKLVNDSRGHDVGDQLLVAVAARLTATARPHDTVARFGGDEFVVVCEQASGSQAAALAEQVVEVLGEPFDIAGATVHAAASVGVATAVGSATSSSDLLRYADAAMYRAKAAGRGRVRVFDPTLAADVEDEYALAADLRVALARDDLDVHYQPVVDLASGAVVGLEALARWRHLARGPVPPTRFVAVAERCGLAAALDRWVLRRALHDMARLRASGVVPPATSLAVNLSASNFGDPALDGDLRQWVQRAGLRPEQISLEITETAIMADSAVAVAVLGRLRQQGFRIAVDDFGTGYSSLAYLRDLPITTLKIDRSFIAEITGDAGALAIVATILELAGAVGVDVVAEGVETAEQAALLRTLGCGSAQGWWWSRAVPADDLARVAWAGPAAGPAEDGGQPAPGPAALEPALARLLELQAAGASLGTIAEALDREEHRTPSGHRWHVRAVASALRDLARP
jgi:diguanylate cyclase (GGDEF)-like protein/PAS domain S-box-containing protein